MPTHMNISLPFAISLGWGSAGSFSDPKRIEEVLNNVQEKVDTVRNALEVLQYIQGFKFEDLMIAK